MNLGLTTTTCTHLMDGSEYPQAFLSLGGSYGQVQMAEPIDRKHNNVPPQWVEAIGLHLLRDDVVLGANYVRDTNAFWSAY